MIRERQESLKAKYVDFAAKQEKDNTRDLVNGFGLSEEEAKAALEFCEGDEIECQRRLTEEKEFIDLVRDALLTQKMAKASKKRRSCKCFTFCHC